MLRIIILFLFITQSTLLHASGVPRVLHILTSDTCGGIRTNFCNTIKAFRELSTDIFAVVPKNCSQETLDRIGGSNTSIFFFKNMNGLEEIIADVTRDYEIDIVHVHRPGDVQALRRFRNRRPFKLIYTIHDNSSEWHPAAKKADGVICVNHPIQNAIHKKLAAADVYIPTICINPLLDERPFTQYLEQKKKTKVPYFTERSAFFKKEFDLDVKNSIVLVAAGRLCPIKDHRTLIKAAIRLKREDKLPIQLIIAGPGSEFDTLKRQIDDADAAAFVHLVGYTDKIKDLMYFCDMHIITSLQEAFPMVIMESAALKKAVISSHTHGAHEMIQDRVNGLLFEPRNVGELCTKIRWAVANQELFTSFGQELYNQNMKDFSFAKTFSRLLGFYQLVHTL